MSKGSEAAWGEFIDRTAERVALEAEHAEQCRVSDERTRIYHDLCDALGAAVFFTDGDHDAVLRTVVGHLAGVFELDHLPPSPALRAVHEALEASDGETGNHGNIFSYPR